MKTTSENNIVPLEETYDLLKAFNGLLYYFTQEERQALFKFLSVVADRVANSDTIH